MVLGWGWGFLKLSKPRKSREGGSFQSETNTKEPREIRCWSFEGSAGEGVGTEKGSDLVQISSGLGSGGQGLALPCCVALSQSPQLIMEACCGVKWCACLALNRTCSPWFYGEGRVLLPRAVLSPDNLPLHVTGTVQAHLLVKVFLFLWWHS